MCTALTRRRFLSRPAAAALATAVAGLAVPLGAQALDLTLPKFQDLRPKWQAVGLGATDAQVILAMGSPTFRTESRTLGVDHLTLEWKDMAGVRYTARFMAGRLYAKRMSDAG